MAKRSMVINITSKKTNGIRYDDIILKASSGKRYYFESDGKLSCSKWFTKNGSHYYSESNGVLASGWLTVSGKKILYESVDM